MAPTKQKEIRAYLMSGAGGTFHGVDAYDVLMQALSHSKIVDCSGEEFAQVLKSHGIVPDYVRANDYRLVLPTASRSRHDQRTGNLD